MAQTLCSRCGGPLAMGILAGQCPRCLGALAFTLEDPGGPSGPCNTGDYDLLRELGRGGMGIVYEAHQRSVNRRVAVKLLAGGALALPSSLHRFRAEAEAAARLRHPNIVTVHEIGEREQQPFIAMELVTGPSLADLVRSQPMAPQRAARYVRLVAEGIAHAHAAGVLHRDLKPSNVLIDAVDQPRVTDFGLAKFLDDAADLTRTGEVLGSPGYLAPELVSGGSAEVASDVYSLGAILYQLISGRPPFAADTVAATLQQVLHDPPVPPRVINSTVPADLETICLKCLHKEPTRRYPTAAALAADLARFEAGEPVTARPISHAEQLGLWCRRNPALASVSIGLIFVLVAGAVGILAQWHRAEVSREGMARNLYAADVAAAATALADGNLGQARSLLLRHAPGPGRKDSPGGVEFTWRLLWERCQSDEIATLGTHPWIVTCVAASPDGQWLASGSQDQPDAPLSCLKLWRLGAADGPSIQELALPVSNTVWSVAFTPDSRTLMSAGADGVRFWDIPTGRPKAGYPILPGHEATLAGDLVVSSPHHPFAPGTPPDPLVALTLSTLQQRTLTIRGTHPALSPEGRRLAVLDPAGNIEIHDLRTGRPPLTLATNQPSFRLRFSPDGSRLAAVGRSAVATVWNLDTPGSPPRRIRSAHNLWDATFTPDGRTLITANSHQKIQFWDPETALLGHSLAGHDNEVWTVAATPDGRHLVSGSKDRTVRLWSFNVAPELPSPSAWRYARPTFSPDGTRLLTYAQTNGRGAALVWEPHTAGRGRTQTARWLGALGGFPRGFAPDGQHILFLNADRPALDWRSIATGETTRTVALAGASTNLFPAEFVLAGDGRSFACPDTEGTFWRWSTEDGRLLHRWREDAFAHRFRARFEGGQRPTRLLRSHAGSHSGRWLVLGPSGAVAALLVDFEEGTSTPLQGHRDEIAGLAFSPDDRLIASGSVDGTIRLWSVADGRSVAELPGHLESVEAVCFSPDGQTLASVNPGIEVAFWHLPTRRQLARLPHPEAGYFLSFSPDGRHLALSLTRGGADTATDRVALWVAP